MVNPVSHCQQWRKLGSEGLTNTTAMTARTMAAVKRYRVFLTSLYQGDGESFWRLNVLRRNFVALVSGNLLDFGFRGSPSSTSTTTTDSLNSSSNFGESSFPIVTLRPGNFPEYFQSCAQKVVISNAEMPPGPTQINNFSLRES